MIYSTSKHAKLKCITSQICSNPTPLNVIHWQLKAKQVADKHLRESGLIHAIVRPGTLKNDPGSGKIKIAEKLNEMGEITREDVARVIVAALNDDTANNETFEILEGDILIGEALSKVSA